MNNAQTRLTNSAHYYIDWRDAERSILGGLLQPRGVTYLYFQNTSLAFTQRVIRALPHGTKAVTLRDYGARQIWPVEIGERFASNLLNLIEIITSWLPLPTLSENRAQLLYAEDQCLQAGLTLQHALTDIRKDFHSDAVTVITNWRALMDEVNNSYDFSPKLGRPRPGQMIVQHALEIIFRLHQVDATIPLATFTNLLVMSLEQVVIDELVHSANIQQSLEPNSFLRSLMVVLAKRENLTHTFYILEKLLAHSKVNRINLYFKSLLT